MQNKSPPVQSRGRRGFTYGCDPTPRAIRRTKTRSAQAHTPNASVSIFVFRKPVLAHRRWPTQTARWDQRACLPRCSPAYSAGSYKSPHSPSLRVEKFKKPHCLFTAAVRLSLGDGGHSGEMAVAQMRTRTFASRAFARFAFSVSCGSGENPFINECTWAPPDLSTAWTESSFGILLSLRVSRLNTYKSNCTQNGQYIHTRIFTPTPRHPSHRRYGSTCSLS